jgi:hypothetical protein
MEDLTKYQHIIDKLSSGMRFGLFEDYSKCYFEDGEYVSYTNLWKALRIKNNLPDMHHKTIAQLCPKTFIGSYSHKFAKHRWNPRQPFRPFSFLLQNLHTASRPYHMRQGGLAYYMAK